MECSGGMVEYQTKNAKTLGICKVKVSELFLRLKTVILIHFFPVVAYMMESINNEISNLTRMKNLFLSCKEKFH